MEDNRRYMFFVDGTNFLIELSKEIDVPFRAERPPLCAFNFAYLLVKDIEHYFSSNQIIRHYWFGSYQGSDKERKEISSYLRQYNFEPILIQKKKGREKGVDISLTKEMLVNAFNQNFDVGYLIAGDEDYLSLVMETKRYGPRIHGAFFEHGLSEELRIAFDSFRELKRHILIEKDWDNLVIKIKDELNKPQRRE